MTNHDNLEQDAVNAYETLRAGGLVLLPTDVGYGLVAMEERAVERLYELKGRPLSKPCITVANGPIFDALVRSIEPGDRAWLAETSAQSPIAVIAELDSFSPLVQTMSAYMHAQATQNGTIATFHSAGPIVERVAELAFADDRVVVGSSANLSGIGNNYTFDEVTASMRYGVDLAIDRGPASFTNDGRLATTILDLRTGTFARRGINHALIERSWMKYRKLAVAAS